MALRCSFITLLGTSLVIVGCGQKAPPPQMLTVQTSKIGTSVFKPTVEAVSMLDGTKTVSLEPETDGRVVRILANEGQSVKAGQPIIVLDNTQQSAQLNASRAQAKTDQINAERYEFLYQSGAVSAKKRDQYATTAITSRDQAIADAATLGYKFVRAPIDGIIGDLDTVKLGDYIQKGEFITGIVNNTTLWTLMDIPASQSSQVKIGQTVNVTSQSTPPVTGQGSVTFISPYFNINSKDKAPNTLMVKATFPNLTGKMKTGQFVTSQIITGQQEILAVPVTAVFMQAEQPFVYTLVPLREALPKIKANPTVPPAQKKKLSALPPQTPLVFQRPVKLGPLQGNFYPIKSGLKKGEAVVITNTAFLTSGMPVKVKNTGN